MVRDMPSEVTPRFTIKLVGLRPGTSQEDMVSALLRLYRQRSQEEVRRALGRLPFVLSHSLKEEQARKVQRFLESKGAILDVHRTVKTPAREPEPKPVPSTPKPSIQPEPQVKQAATTPGTLAQETGPARGERRAKPRIHPGILLQPMGVGEILDRTFRLLRERFWLFLVIMIIPLGLVSGLLVVLGLLFGGAGLLAVGLGLGTKTALGVGGALFFLLVFLLIFFIQIWAQGALINAVSETYLGHQTSVSASYRALRPRLGRLVATILLMVVLIVVALVAFGLLGTGIIALGQFLGQTLRMGLIGVLVMLALSLAGVLCFVVPAMFLFLNWLLADKVVVLENLSGWSALKRSRELMNARTETGFWKKPKVKAGLILLVAFLIGIAILLLFQLPQMFFQILMPGDLLALTLVQALYLVGNSLATTFGSMAMILFYYDIRIRREGFDLKMMAENL
jgi:hypothetical protein